MPLVIGLAALLGAVLLLTSGITDASFADVATGKAGQLYRANQTPAGSSGTVTTTAAGPAPTGTQKQQIAQVAAAEGLDPKTLWGVFGTESDFGRDTSTSSAGAEGPFQFIPSTWSQYGRGNVQNFTDALTAAARLLKALGADGNPNSPATIQALNNYNGNRGGTSLTGYAQKVLSLGGSF